MKTSDSRDRKVEKRNKKRKQWKGGGKGWIGAVHNKRIKESK
jgi:hypothetical protein